MVSTPYPTDVQCRNMLKFGLIHSTLAIGGPGIRHATSPAMSRTKKPTTKKTSVDPAKKAECACEHLEHVEGDRWWCIDCGKTHIQSQAESYEGEDEYT